MKRKYSLTNDLQYDGYTIYRNVISFSDDEISKIMKKSKYSQKIFNTEKNDGLRKQIKISNDLMKSTSQFLSNEFPNHKQNDWNIIKSKAGCKVQMAHCDYILNDELKNVNDENCPLAVIVAIMPETTLRVWKKISEFTSPVYHTDVKLDIGDILIFRADLVHAGSGYDKENVRIHVYLDTDYVIRNPNKTWIIRKHAPSFIQDNIIEID